MIKEVKILEVTIAPPEYVHKTRAQFKQEAKDMLRRVIAIDNGLRVRDMHDFQLDHIFGLQFFGGNSRWNIMAVLPKIHEFRHVLIDYQIKGSRPGDVLTIKLPIMYGYTVK